MASLPLSAAASVARRPAVRVAALALPAILILALALRLLAASVPSIHHPDEIFQYLEPAHRLVFGYGVVTWEWKYGIRSWLFPLILAGPMKLGALLAPSGALYLQLPRLLMVAVSMSLPWSAWALGRRWSRTHGLFAAFVAATWSEFVYFAPHTLSENMATAAMLPAAALLSGRETRDRRTLVVAGMLLGFAALIRFQLAPALAVLAVMGCGRDPRRWAVLIAGGLAIATVGAAVDLAMGMVPFAWLFENVRQNLIENRAAQYGTMGPLGYVTWAEHIWGWWLLPIAILVRIGWRRQRALGWAALANVVFHSLIAHKEYRFVEFSAAAFVVIAALGTVDVVRMAETRFPRLPRGLAVALAGLVWLGGSVGVATGKEMRTDWAQATDTLADSAIMRDDPAICGVALLPDLVEWGGYSYLHRDVPVSFFNRFDPALGHRTAPQALAEYAPTYNRILSARVNAPFLPPGFVEQRCTAALGSSDPELCVYARTGGCHGGAASPFLLSTVFDRVDQQTRENIRKGLRPVD